MTGDQTSLEVSERLLATGLKPHEGQRTWYVGDNEDGRYGASYVACHPAGNDDISAYTLAELEAETRRMGLEVTIIIHANGDVQVAVWGEAYSPPVDNVIDALGAALAEAKEKA